MQLSVFALMLTLSSPMAGQNSEASETIEFLRLSTPADTVVVLGSRSVDMTGDGQPELLQVVGAGESLDSLDVTFSIIASDQVLYSDRLRTMTPTAGFDAGRRTLSPEDYRRRLAEFEARFFAEQKFLTTDEFIEKLRGRASRHIHQIQRVIARDGEGSMDLEKADAVWEDIQGRALVVFEYSGGGDGITAIAWSEIDRRFHRLWECC